MTIFLLRHGQLESSGPKRYIGQTDTALSRKGRDQARIWRTVLSEKHLEGIYASDLSRCAETARIIAGQEPEDVRLLPALREIHLGKLEGLAMDFVREQLPDDWEKRGRDLAGYRPDGGESFTDLYRRVIPAFETIARGHEENVLIVGHAGVNRIILCHILGMPVSNLFRIAQSHACLNTLEVFGDFFRVIRLNQSCPQSERPDICSSRLQG